MRLVSYDGDHRSAKALITASLLGVPLQAEAPGQDVVQGAGLVDAQISPLGHVPVLLLDCGTCLFGSNAIARYLARLPSQGGSALYGATPEETGLIDAWLDFAAGELEPPLMSWVLPLLGVWPHSHQKEEAAVAAVSRALRALDAHLSRQAERLSSDYAVGRALSLADVVIVCSLARGFAHVFDPAFRAGFPAVVGYFTRCLGRVPQFRDHLGDLQLCERRLVHVEKKQRAGSVQQGQQAQQAKQLLHVPAWDEAQEADHLLQQLQLLKELYRSTPAESIAEVCSLGGALWQGEDVLPASLGQQPEAESNEQQGQPATPGIFRGLRHLPALELWLFEEEEEQQHAQPQQQQQELQHGSHRQHLNALIKAKKLARLLQPAAKYVFGVACVVRAADGGFAARGALVCPASSGAATPAALLPVPGWRWTLCNDEASTGGALSLLSQLPQLEGGAAVLELRIIK